MHDKIDIGQPDPLRLKVFGPEQMSDGERLGHLIEFVADLDDRLKRLENPVTERLRGDIQAQLAEFNDDGDDGEEQ